jgi:hypothetical protein
MGQETRGHVVTRGGEIVQGGTTTGIIYDNRDISHRLTAIDDAIARGLVSADRHPGWTPLQEEAPQEAASAGPSVE